MQPFRSPSPTPRAARVGSGARASILAACLLRCGTDVSHVEYHRHVAAPADAGLSAEVDAAGQGPPFFGPGVPVPDTPPAALSLDVFGVPGAHYWLVVSDGELERINQLLTDEVDEPVGSFEDLYWAAPAPGSEPFAEHLVVSTPGDDPHSADFGQVSVRLDAERRNRWTPQTLPDLSVDVAAFSPAQRIGDLQRLRFHGAVIGDIFREKLALELFKRLGYAAPRANYVWLSSTVWGAEIAVPYLVVEAYDRLFCERSPELGGGCENLWQLTRDLGGGGFANPAHCLSGSCDPERALELEREVAPTLAGDGYQAALGEWLDWQSFHEYQCLSWILATGRDPLRNSFNPMVFVERADGKFQYLPAALGISLGHEAAPSVTLPGVSALADGCQNDPQCWAETITTCEGLLGELAAADPVGMLRGIHAELEALGMLRGGDEERYQELVGYLTRRLVELPYELELNRPAPYFDCQAPFVRCGRECREPEFCVLCEPEPPLAADAGAAPPEPIDCVPPVAVPPPLSVP